MSNIFADRLSALRKERRISQKDASAFFGISQALLSHYENGIRQCGTDFVIKAAGFYGVSTDYLLGISDAKTASEEVFLSSQPGDGKLSYATLQRTAGILCRKLDESSPKTSSEDLSIQCIYIFNAMLRAAVSGKIPSNWLGINSSYEASEMLRTISTLNLNSSHNDGKITLMKSDEPVPDCVKTVIRESRKTFADIGSRLFDMLSEY